MLARTLFATIFVTAALPGFARGAEPAWIADPRTGCKVVNANPQPNESIAWSGGCDNSFAQGPGVLQWFENGRPAERYEGEMRAGQMEGRGTLNTGDGGHYEGEFRAGKADGVGQWTTAHGSFNGVWKNGCFNDGSRRAWVGADASACP